MEILKTRRTESPQHAFDRVCEQFLEVSDRALGPKATREDIENYNSLHAQLLEHRDGTRGHLHIQRERIVFEGSLFGHKLSLVRPINPEKIAYKLKPGTNTVIV